MTEPSQPSPPLLIVVMGVSGSGKSTLAKALADELGFLYLDADDFHSDLARAHMANGQPLTDDMRVPWVDAICTQVNQLAQQGKNCTLAFSGLKRAHRELLRQTHCRVVFLFLDGQRDLILERLLGRMGHFMPPALLDSQFSALELPDEESDVLPVGIIDPPSEMTRQALSTLKQHHIPITPTQA